MHALFLEFLVADYGEKVVAIRRIDGTTFSSRRVLIDVGFGRFAQKQSQ